MFKQRLNAPVGDRLSFVVLPSRSILNEDCLAGFGFCLPHERPLGTKEQVLPDLTTLRTFLVGLLL